MQAMWKAGGAASSRAWRNRPATSPVSRPPFGVRACAAMANSSVDVSRTGAAIGSTAKDEAAALKGFG